MRERFRGFLELDKIVQALNSNILILSIRESLVSLIPILIVGTFALVGRTFPVQAYQNWIIAVFGGALYNFLQTIYQATFGLLSIYMTISLSSKYSNYRGAKNYNAGAVLSATAAFAIFSGVMSDSTFHLDYLGPMGMFTAMVCSIISVCLYEIIWQKINFTVNLYSNGMDSTFYHVLKSIIPIFVIIVLFSVVNIGIIELCGVDCFQTWFSDSLTGLFENMGNSLQVTLLFVLVEQVMWFFGIHGSDVLDAPKDMILGEAMQRNLDAVAAGEAATEIFTGTFLDVFVLMGGCGATWALLMAILIFSKRRSNRALSNASAIPMIFNINEIMVFGLPIVCNPIFLIPFLLAPLLMVVTSYLAIWLGLVPVTVRSIEWTTPVFLSGYLATGSVAGALLQLFNLGLGILVYAPFVKIYDRMIENTTKEKMKRLVEELQKSEESREPIELLSLKNDYGNIAKNLADELDMWIKSGDITLYYQPQYNHEGEMTGAEALLRWEHPTYGMMYPPLVIKLAEETGNLMNMEKAIFRRAAKDMKKMESVFGKIKHISVNVTGTTIQGDEFEDFLRELKGEYPEVCEHILIEITEQAALRIDNPFIERLARLREMGYVFGIDDFSMGNTSIKYLQSNVFSLVKLDGEISKDILDNTRSKEIVSSIAQLTHDLGVSVLAEYVETEPQRQVLEDVGCYLYQGYLYSPAITLEEFLEKCK